MVASPSSALTSATDCGIAGGSSSAISLSEFLVGTVSDVVPLLQSALAALAEGGGGCGGLSLIVSNGEDPPQRVLGGLAGVDRAFVCKYKGEKTKSSVGVILTGAAEAVVLLAVDAVEADSLVCTS